MLTKEELKYTQMQKNWYEHNARASYYENGICLEDHIVGNFPNQEKFPYEQWIFKYYTPSKDDICYEYGCGPGRQIRRMLSFFKRVDGVDISQQNLDNAKKYIGSSYNGILKVTDGTQVPLEDKYDFCYSIICLQHIPCYTVRRKILENMYNSLKEGGRITIQLAFGSSMNGTPTFGYTENFYDATMTNGRLDCRVDSKQEVILDFVDIGFKNVTTELSNTVDDHHPCWIWIYGQK